MPVSNDASIALAAAESAAASASTAATVAEEIADSIADVAETALAAASVAVAPLTQSAQAAATDAAVAATSAAASADAAVAASETASAIALGDADAALAVAVRTGAMKMQRRQGITDRALANAGGWTIKRRSVNYYSLVRSLGEGWYAHYALNRARVDSSGNATTAAALPMVWARETLARPMIAQDSRDGVVLGGTWQSQVSTYTGLNLVIDGMGEGQITVSITTTAGSATATLVGGLATLPLDRTAYIGRTAVIQGAGVGGAPLTAKLNNITTGAVITLGTVPSTSVTGASSVILPGRQQTAQVGATATKTFPLGATEIGVVHSVIGVGGLATVAIDGSLTAATSLPTAQDVVDAGFFAPTILTTNGGTIAPTTRVLDSWYGSDVYDVRRILARDLDPTVVHTAVLTTTAYYNLAATVANGVNLYIAGWGYATPTTTLATAKAAMFSQWIGSYSTEGTEASIDFQPAGTTAKAFAGGSGHGYEAETQAPAFVIDGTPVTLTDGQTVQVAGNAVITRKSDLYHAEVPGSPAMRQAVTYRLDVNGLHISEKIDWLVNADVPAAYMLQHAINLPHVQLDGSGTAYNLADDVTHPDLAWLGDGEHTAVVWWGGNDATSRARGDLAGQVMVGVLFPLSKAATRGYSGAHKVTVRKWATDLRSKLYGQATTTAAAGDVWTAEQTLVMGRLADGTVNHFPLA
jgi:hypothetical protein